MTKRFSYGISWAQDGFIEDPDLDTTDPSYVPNRYEELGWVAEKPPEQWQNFLTNIGDVKLSGNVLKNGVAEFEQDIPYKKCAITFNSGIKIVNEQLVLEDPLSVAGPEYSRLVNATQRKVDEHVADSRAHKDTVDNLGGGGTYLGSDVDTWFGSETDNRTIVWHKLQTGAVHKETPEQVGTLPTGGGKFTGLVSMLDGIRINGPSTDAYIKMNNNYYTQVVMSFQYSKAFFLTESGDVYSNIDGKNYKWLTENSFEEFMTKSNYLFTEPQPFIRACFFDSISDGDSAGDWCIVSDSEPTYHAGGGVFVFGNNLIMRGTFPQASIKRLTSYIVGRKANGDLVCRVIAHANFLELFSPATGGGNYVRRLLDGVGCQDIAYLIQYAVYPFELTSQQTSSIRFI